MTLQEVLDKTVRFFKDKNLDSPRLDAELLLAKAMGFRRIDLYLKHDQPMGETELAKCRDFVRRRSQGEPVAYILGEKDFFGMTFQVDSRVLVPRPETELLVEETLEYLKKQNLFSSAKLKNRSAEQVEPASASTEDELESLEEALENAHAALAEKASEAKAQESVPAKELQILDMGCGSGCLGLSVLSKIPNARLTAVDLSNDALEVTKANAERLGLLARCEFIQGDAATVDLGNRKFDVVLANPPYIAKGDSRLQPEVAKFEPNLALFAEDDGFACIKKWSEHVLPLMNENAWIGFEFGAGQEDRAQAQFEQLGLKDVRIIKDLADLPRHVVGRKGFLHG